MEADDYESEFIYEKPMNQAWNTLKFEVDYAMARMQRLNRLALVTNK
jgi:hypothetical protein